MSRVYYFFFVIAYRLHVYKVFFEYIIAIS